jgi:hypothetical protein
MKNTRNLWDEFIEKNPEYKTRSWGSAQSGYMLWLENTILNTTAVSGKEERQNLIDFAGWYNINYNGHILSAHIVEYLSSAEPEKKDELFTVKEIKMAFENEGIYYSEAFLLKKLHS